MSISNVFVKMHTGDPGSAGTANAATSDTRKALSVGDEAEMISTEDNSAHLVQDTDLVWASGEVEATETWAWVSFWTEESGGTHLGNEDIGNISVTSAEAETVPAGTILVTDPVVADHILREALFLKRISDRQYRNWQGSLRATQEKMQRDKFARQSPQTI